MRDVGPGRDRRPRDPEGKLALFSAAEIRPRPGVVVVQCSDCGVSTELSYLDFAIANLPVGVWLPVVGGRFNRRMTCPSCRRWTWMRARWW
jgi:hypothetical protein